MNDLIVILILVGLAAAALYSCTRRKNRGCGGNCGACNGCGGCSGSCRNCGDCHHGKQEDKGSPRN